MTFTEILPRFLAGAKIQRGSWIKDNWIDLVDNDIRHSNGHGNLYVLDRTQLGATDWELHQEPQKKVTVYEYYFKTDPVGWLLSDNLKTEAEAVVHFRFLDYKKTGRSFEVPG